MITLDTHATIWWTQAPEHLSLPAADAIRQADRILIPAIVFWVARDNQDENAATIKVRMPRRLAAL